jgi:catechol 2,3-dioxygenase-like lactoylglutathione lyase family enzyme
MRNGSVHHVALGVNDLPLMRHFYEKVLEFTTVYIEIEDGEKIIMSDVLRTSHVVFHGASIGQQADGIGLELIRLTDPVPRPIRKDFAYGDIGVAKIAIAVSDVTALYEELKGQADFCFTPRKVAIPSWGEYQFVYCRDPEGNMVEFIHAPKVAPTKKFGGIRWVGIAVTDLDRSVSFYQNLLGFDKLLVPTHTGFTGMLDEIVGNAESHIRSCLLGSSLDDGVVELFEVTKPRGRSIPFGVTFGDFGYLQTCFYHSDIAEIISYCNKSGIEYLTGLKVMDDGIPEHAGSFIYIKDPDGVPVEFLWLHNLSHP